jgi:hypothetical protein
MRELRARFGNRPRYRFMLDEWLLEEERAGVSTLWLTTPRVDESTRETALRRGALLLVPAVDSALRSLCCGENCGLYYGDSQEAVACLEFVRHHREVASIMQRSSCRLAASRRAQTVGLGTVTGENLGG